MGCGGWELAPISWEAVATLATGFAAVIAAMRVGRAQVEIAGRQSRILERQVELDELRHRAEVFEKRVAVYRTTARFLATIVAEADQVSGELEHQFQVAMENEAVFLFRREVYDRMKEVWQKYCSFGLVRSNMKALYAREGHYGDGNSEKQHDLLLWFHETLKGLHDLFGDELRLAAREPEAPRPKAQEKPQDRP